MNNQSLQLSSEEKTLIKLLYNKNYRYVARDKNNQICFFKNEPIKAKENWESIEANDWITSRELFDDLFKSITWKDINAQKLTKLLE